MFDEDLVLVEQHERLHKPPNRTTPLEGRGRLLVMVVFFQNIPVTGYNKLAQDLLSECFIGATRCCSFHSSISSATKDAGLWPVTGIFRRRSLQ
jgi:hypothetical protein